MNQYDALVIGGGPAGATAAALLAQAGWSVAIVEERQFPRRKVCGEYLSATNWPLMKRLGIEASFLAQAGPPVTQVAVYAGRASACADLPRNAEIPWGRALSRDRLDLLLLENAAHSGADTYQATRCVRIAKHADRFVGELETQSGQDTTAIQAAVVIAAHGSWGLGKLPTQQQSLSNRPADWLAFKAHLTNTKLPDGLMPLLSFPDGYGGLVHCDDGRVSLSCCILRRRLQRLSRGQNASAGAAVFDHILNSSPALRPMLEDASVDGSWLSAGPIRPGVRQCHQDGIYVVGNAAGEAHPVVAEGISMAMQSAWLLARYLIPEKRQLHLPATQMRVAAAYRTAWRRSFVPRIRTAAAVAQWACRPALMASTLPALRVFPGLLTWGAQWSGKTNLAAYQKLPGTALLPS
jgi:flavin-dependent dehydrogenase